MTNAIKLYPAGLNQFGDQRLQSQLMVGKMAADFILIKDGPMQCWGHGNKGLDFYEFTDPYEIVTDIKSMNTQTL